MHMIQSATAGKAVKGPTGASGLAAADRYDAPPGKRLSPAMAYSSCVTSFPIRDGEQLYIDIYRPNIDGKFPAPKFRSTEIRCPLCPTQI
jgi:predicted acyl esterase